MEAIIVHRTILFYEFQMMKKILGSDYSHTYSYQQIMSGNANLTVSQGDTVNEISDYYDGKFKAGFTDFNYYLNDLKCGGYNGPVNNTITNSELRKLMVDFIKKNKNKELQADYEYVIDIVLKEIGEQPFLKKDIYTSRIVPEYTGLTMSTPKKRIYNLYQKY